MMNATALVIAPDRYSKTLITGHLSATGLFQRIIPVASIAGLFKVLKSASADMICWAMDKALAQENWIDRLQAQKKWHDLPLIAFADDQQSLISGFELGASDVVHLTIDPLELSARMKRHLQRWERLCELRKAQEELHYLALTDPLTRIGNRSTFDMSIKQVAARSRRNDTPYSLMLIDLDHFKKVNDTHGHQAGDNILKKVAAAIQGSARASDICCRYGGEEFVVILPDADAKDARTLAERIHRQVAKMSRTLPKAHQPVTVSIGICSSADFPHEHPSRLLEQADLALYQAKHNGRNRTEIRRCADELRDMGFYAAAVQSSPVQYSCGA